MSDRCSVDALAVTIMEGLEEYAKASSEDVKEAVRKAGKDLKSEISSSAPKKTGKYAKSWTVTTQKETANSLELVVHSKNRYQLAHLLEKGHAKRGGGRVAAKPHIAPAEEKIVAELEAEIQRKLGG